MAGGALGGVFGAALRLFPWYREDLVETPFFDNEAVSQLVSIVGFSLFCLYLWRKATRVQSDDAEGFPAGCRCTGGRSCAVALVAGTLAVSRALVADGLQASGQPPATSRPSSMFYRFAAALIVSS